MGLGDYPLAWFEVDCDGSACGSGNVPLHVHPPQDGKPAMARVRVRDGQRAGYGEATGITRLVMTGEAP